MENRIICLSFGIIISLSLFSQNPKVELSMPSPNAASLGKFGEIPVSLFTGLPNIQIPIYELQSGDIKLPISLNYHASGVKLDQHPGWVGLNWDLNAGGAITRIVRDLPDEYDCPNTPLKLLRSTEGQIDQVLQFLGVPSVTGEKAGYFFNHAINDANNWAEESRILEMVSGVFDGKDTEPDKFTFNFAGYSGVFYLNSKGDWKVQSNSNLKVVFNSENLIDLPVELFVSKEKHYQANCQRYGDNLKSFGGFTIIDDNGVQYVFGSEVNANNTDAIEYSVPFFTQKSEQWLATTWYLTKIIHPSGHSIKLVYEPDDYISSMYIYFRSKQELYMNDKNQLPCGNPYGNSYAFGNEGEWTADWIYPRYASYLGHLIRPTYLREINNENVKVLFTRENSNALKYDNKIYLKNDELSEVVDASNFHQSLCQTTDDIPEKFIAWPFLYEKSKSKDLETQLKDLVWKKLVSISIESKTNSEFGWQYVFLYDDTSVERLKLKSISKESMDNDLLIPPYRFEYYDNLQYRLPNYLSESTDHWGYFNENTHKIFTALRTSEFNEIGASILNGDLNNIYALKEPTNNIDKALEGSLKKIYYPTGGSTLFEYEQHSYSKCFDRTDCVDNTWQNCIESYTNDKIAGGLRISKVTSTAQDISSPRIKTYHYVSGYKAGINIETMPSSGILGGKSQYYWSSFNAKTNNTDVTKVERFIYGSQSILPLSTNNYGSHIGYSEVVEINEDDSYSIYKYTNFISEDGNHFDEPPLPGSYNDLSPHTGYTDNSFERGRLISKSDFNKYGTPVRKEEFEYQRYNDEFVKSLMLLAHPFLCTDVNFCTYMGFPYKNQVYKYLPNKKTISRFDQLGYISLQTIENYSYNSYGQNIAISTKKSNGDNFIIENKYPVDYLDFNSQNDGSSDLYNTLWKMYGKNMLNYKISTISEVNGTYNNRQGQVSLYKEENGNIVPGAVYEYKTGAPYTGGGIDFDGKNLPDSKYYRRVMNFDTYDKFGNLTQYHKENDIPTTYVYDYEYTLPIAKLVNAESSEVAYTIFGSDNFTSYTNWEPTYSSSWQYSTDGHNNTGSLGNTEEGVKLRNKVAMPPGKYFFEVSGKALDAGNGSIKTNMLKPWGEPISYAFGSEWIKKSHEFELTQAEIIEIEVDNVRLDNLMIHPVDAIVKTYTHEPLVGISSITDPNRKSTYYKYDNSGRLEKVIDNEGNIVNQYEYNYSGEKNSGDTYIYTSFEPNFPDNSWTAGYGIFHTDATNDSRSFEPMSSTIKTVNIVLPGTYKLSMWLKRTTNNTTGGAVVVKGQSIEPFWPLSDWNFNVRTITLSYPQNLVLEPTDGIMIDNLILQSEESYVPDPDFRLAELPVNTSFEPNFPDQNWTAGYGTFPDDALEGNQSFSPQASTISTVKIVPAGTYKLSMWLKQTPGNTTGGAVVVAGQSIQPFFPQSDWSYGVRTIVLNEPSRIILEPTDLIMIDDLRLQTEEDYTPPRMYVYTSFENFPDKDWTSGYGSFSSDAINGNKSFDPDSETISTVNIIPAGTYKLSMWLKRTTGNTTGGAVTVSGQSMEPFWAQNHWNFNVRTITLTSPQKVVLTVSDNIIIDNLILQSNEYYVPDYTLATLPVNTGFEAFPDQNWTAGYGVFHTDAVYGSKSFEPMATTISTVNVIPTGTYKLSMWIKRSNPGVTSGGTVSIAGKSSIQPYFAQDDWNYLVRTITLSSPQRIMLDPTQNVMIDGLRLQKSDDYTPPDVNIYTGFENFPDKSWTAGYGTFSSDSKSGSKSFEPQTTIRTVNNIPAGTYKLSMWLKRAPGNTTGGAVSVEGQSIQPFFPQSDWSYSERTITISNQKLTLIPTYSARILIDELRLELIDDNN